MTNETSVPLLDYLGLRPDGSIESLTPTKPKMILLAVDGPRFNRTNDGELVRQILDLVCEITRDAEIRTLFRDSNLGLMRKSVLRCSFLVHTFFVKALFQR